MFGGFVESLAPDFPDVEVRTYVAGKDDDYIPKYGMVTKSMLILNESKVITDISKMSIRKAFMKLSKEAQH